MEGGALSTALLRVEAWEATRMEIGSPTQSDGDRALTLQGRRRWVVGCAMSTELYLSLWLCINVTPSWSKKKKQHLLKPDERPKYETLKYECHINSDRSVCKAGITCNVTCSSFPVSKTLIRIQKVSLHLKHDQWCRSDIHIASYICFILASVFASTWDYAANIAYKHKILLLTHIEIHHQPVQLAQTTSSSSSRCCRLVDEV